MARNASRAAQTVPFVMDQGAEALTAFNRWVAGQHPLPRDETHAVAE